MSRSLRDIFNEGNPNKVPAANRSVRMGDLLNNVSQGIGGLTTAPTLAFAFAGAAVLTPAETRRARVGVLGYVRAGGTPGFALVGSPITAPGAGQLAVGPQGRPLFETGVTDAEVTYCPVEGPVIEDFVDVAASAATLLRGNRAQTIIEVEVLVGATPGVKLVTFRGQGASVGGEVALSDDGLSVDFNAADVVAGTARIRYIAQPGNGAIVRSVGDELNAVDKDF